MSINKAIETTLNVEFIACTVVCFLFNKLAFTPEFPHGPFTLLQRHRARYAPHRRAPQGALAVKSFALA